MKGILNLSHLSTSLLSTSLNSLNSLIPSNISKSLKGQMSVEFFLLFVIIIAVFSLFMFIAFEIEKQVTYLINYNNAVSVVSKIGNAVNQVIAYNINTTVGISFGYKITSLPDALIATDLHSNVSASWPISHVQTVVNVPDGSININISMQNNTIYLNG